MSARKRVWIVTGGIGSGKSAVRRILEGHGFTGIDSDSVGHSVLEPDGEGYESVAGEWPTVVGPDGSIDRARLGHIVFSNEQALRKLEELTHPHIFDRISARIQENDVSDFAVEIPVMKKSVEASLTVVVDARDEVRLRRVMERGLSEDAAKARMAAQPSRAAWLASGDAVIPNEGSLEELASTVSRLVHGQ